MLSFTKFPNKFKAPYSISHIHKAEGCEHCFYTGYRGRTAIYEIIPQSSENLGEKSFTIDFRYKNPDEDISIPLSLDVFDEGNTFNQSSDFMRFTASVASFSMLLRDSQYKGTSSYNQVINWLDTTSLTDEHNFKSQLRNIVQQASNL